MKRKYLIITIGVIIVIGLLVVAMVNESHKVKLKCVKTEKQSGLETSSKVNLTFYKKKLKLAESINSVKVTKEEYKKNIESTYKSLEERYKDIKEDKGVIVKINKTNDSVILNITVDAKKSPSKVEYIGSSIKQDMDYDASKKALEKLEYTCK